MCCVYIETNVITGSLFNMLYTLDAKILSFCQELGIHYFVSIVVIGQKTAFGIKLSFLL